MARTVLMYSAVVLITALGIRLWNIGSPPNIIYDEVHFGTFMNSILQRKYIFDVFPPLGKLALAAAAKVVGWDTSVKYENISQQLDWKQGFRGVRASVALCGAINSMLMVLICSEAELSDNAALLAGFMSALDLMSTTQSRVMMADTFMMTLLELSLLCALRAWRLRRTQNKLRSDDSDKRGAMPWIFYLGLAGVFSGLALATKWTAHTVPTLIMFISFFGVPPLVTDGPVGFPALLIFLGGLLGSYFGTFTVFIKICNHTGQGDAFMSPEFQKTIIDSTTYDPNARMSVLAKVLELNRVMFRYQKAVRGDGKSGGGWLSWILNQRGVLYSTFPDDSGQSSLYVLMNPVMAFLTQFSMLALVVFFFASVRYSRTYKGVDLSRFRVKVQRGLIFLLSTLSGLLPTIVIYRAGPLYQYLPALLFAQIVTAQVVDLLTPRVRSAAVFTSVALMAAAFAYWSPWAYGTYLTHQGHSLRRWVRTWH